MDANILFSASKSNGSIRRLLNRLLDTGHECWMNDFVIEEARRNIAIKHEERLPELEDLCRRLQVAKTAAMPLAIDTDPQLSEKDEPVLATAICLGCQVLVTGDRKHFGTFYGTTIRGVAIHSPRSLAEALAAGL